MASSAGAASGFIARQRFHRRFADIPVRVSQRDFLQERDRLRVLQYAEIFDDGEANGDIRPIGRAMLLETRLQFGEGLGDGARGGGVAAAPPAGEAVERFRRAQQELPVGRRGGGHARARPGC